MYYNYLKIILWLLWAIKFLLELKLIKFMIS